MSKLKIALVYDAIYPYAKGGVCLAKNSTSLPLDNRMSLHQRSIS